MTDAAFTPIVYVKEGCPFCLKLRIFLLEAGLIDDVELRGQSAGEESEIREELSNVLDQVTLPTVQFAQGDYLSDSDAIITRFATQASIDPERLPTLKAYIEGPLASLRALYMENVELTKKLT